MAVSTVKLNGTTLMTVNDTTATQADVNSSKYFYGADGVKRQGSATPSTPTLITKSITANGTYNASSDSADGYSSVTVNVSGGASNVVTGTFTGTTTGAVLEVSTGYTGNGHPIRISIAPKDGAYNSSSTFYSTIQRYAICSFAGFACKPDGAAGYGSSPGDTMNTLCYYKSSDSSATSYTAYGNASSYILNQNNPTADRMTPVRFPNKSTMKVYIANTSYGFMANIEYHYVIEYSS